jgi:hypothetical protein
MTDEEMIVLAKREIARTEEVRPEYPTLQDVVDLCVLKYVRQLEAQIADLNATIASKGNVS